MAAPDQAPPIDQDRSLHYRAVLLYDVLGQSSQLRTITVLPQTEEDLARTTAAVRATAGTVIKLRTDLRQYFDGLSKSTIDPYSVPPEHRGLFENARKTELVYQNFSDLTVAHVPLMEKSEADNPMASVLGLIGASAAMMLVSLARGTPVRGGIDVGLAVPLEGTEIYGPILDCVYHMESMEAEWPRILVGPTLVDYLNFSVARARESLRDKIRAGLAQKALQLITADTDGRQIIDYLGVGMRKFQGGTLPPAVIDKATAFAANTRDAFVNTGNAKLAARYERVVAYCQKNAGNWR